MKLSSLPRSLREVVTQVKKSGTGAAFVDFGRRASGQQQAQGTRSGAHMGIASSGSTPDPLRPGRTVTPGQPLGWDAPIETPPIIAFSTDDPAYDGAEGTIIQTRDWPPNPSHDSLSPSVGHKEQLRTDGSLQLGPGPGRILRSVPARIWGIANASTGQRGTEASYDGNSASHDYLPHIPVARQALGVKGPQKLSDDNAVIPAVYAGNPRT
jgi:hypothetical protein